jgi:hypothetical protein
MALACPHCAASNIDGSRFCGACGKAMSGVSAPPRVLNNNTMASTPAGQSVQLDDLQRQIKPAISTLFWLGILHACIGMFLFIFGLTDERATGAALNGFVILAIGGIFFGLSYWARKNPLPATVTALCIYGTFVGLNIIVAFAAKNPSNIMLGLFVKIAIAAVLARAVSAAMKHRALSRQMAQPGDQRLRNAA